MNILDIINAAAIKGGIPVDDADLKNLLATPITKDTVVPDKLASAISGLMNLEAAKNNEALKKHFKQNILEPVDTKLLDFATAAGFEAEVLDALKAEKNTYSKPDILKDKLEALVEKKAAAKKTGDSDAAKALQQEIATLRETIKLRDQEITRSKQEAIEALENFKISSLKQKLVSSQEWSDLYPKDVQEILFNTKLDAKLSELNAKIIYKDNKPRLVKRDNPELFVYDQSQNEVLLDGLAAQIMTENKFKKVVSTPATTTIVGASGNPAAPGTTSPAPSLNAQIANSEFAALGIKP